MNRAVCFIAGVIFVAWTFGMSSAALAAPPDFQPDGVPLGQITTDPANSQVPTQYFLGIYSGSTRGVYFYVASAICDAIRARYDEHRIRCAPFRSQGVASNRNLMNQGRAQMALVQSDTNYYAANGSEPIDGARSVVSLYDETGVLVVPSRVRLNTPQDLRNYRVNLAPPGSGAHGLWVDYLESLGLKSNDLRMAAGFAQDLNYSGLCGDFIDAFGLWSGHPVLALQATIERCGAQVLGLWHPNIAQLFERREYYYPSTLPAGTYPGQDEPLQSYGVKASLIAHEHTLPHIVYWVTRVLIEDVALLRTLHPALTQLNPDDMYARGNFLPAHEGAARYWRESGRETSTAADGEAGEKVEVENRPSE